MAFLRRSVLSIVGGLAFAGLAQTASLADVSSDALLQAQDNGGEWLMYGRNYLNQRYSPLDKITKENVSQLKPVFGYSTGGKFAGLEATPLFHDGTLYFTADYARVFALDARTGTVKWYWEPEYEDGLEAVLCCGPVNRGLAISGDKVYVGTLDARLVALNIKDGSVAWEKKIDEWQNAYASTGAPLVVKGKVIVGIAGAEYGVRGYVRAYDAETGTELWTRHTIPGPGEPDHDTWPGDTWKTGGASTWQTGAYDPETNLLYWGTGNPGPWNSEQRPGDNKWTAGIFARDPASGGPIIDAMGRCSDPKYYAAGNMLRPVETAGWCWAEGQAVGRAIFADLKGNAPAQHPPQRQPVTLSGDALSWVVPQFLSGDRALDHLQLRVNQPVKGRLSMRVNGREVASRRIRSRPERRILLPMPSQDGAVTIALEQ